ncbi:MAG TPA: hypothetical protein VNG33_21670 [Polyangiaceae bacterium]|nr:hypothetical protein [Polyangiaceae bacterium]
MRFTTVIRIAFIAAGTMASALSMAGCATAFTGSAHVEDGRAGCERKCKGQGMEVAGMVYMGEYSDACVCAVPGQTGSLRAKYLASAGAVAGGSAGVVMQMRAQEQQHHN